jgi:transposase
MMLRMNETPSLLQGLLDAKDAEISVLRVRIGELEVLLRNMVDRASKDSHNSSKPPSSDGLKKTKSLRKASGLKCGGQVGHKGTTLKRVANPEHVVTHPLPAECGCGAAIDARTARVAQSRQVFDLPPVTIEVTEHRTLTVQCTCGQQHTSAFPVDVTASVQYGARVRAKLVYATQYQLIPIARTRQLMQDWYGITASTATVFKAAKGLGETLAPVVDTIKQAIIASDVVHLDESGYRVNGSLQWLHVAATAQYTWLGCHASRGQIAMNAQGILPALKGVAVHDGLLAYRRYTDCTHAACNAHHLRELVFIAESTQETWPVTMTQCLLDAKKEVDETKGQPLAEERVTHYQKLYKTILDTGFAKHPVITPCATPSTITKKRGRTKQSAATNLLLRLKNHQEDVLRFITDPRVPFDNNAAERAIRMPKLKQKISGGFRTNLGADTFCIIRSYMATLRKQGKNLFDAIVQTAQKKPPDPCYSG